MNKSKKDLPILCIIISLIIIFLAILTGNIITQGLSFYKMTFFEWLGLFMALFISYFLAESKSTAKRLDDKIEKIVESLQRLVDGNKDMIDIQTSNMPSVLNTLKIMGSKISALQSISLKKPEISDRVNYIAEQFKLYSFIITENTSESDEYFARRHDSIHKLLTNMSLKLDDIILILYDCSVPKLDGYTGLNKQNMD